MIGNGDSPLQEACVYGQEIASRDEVVRHLVSGKRLTSHLFAEQMAWMLPSPTARELKNLPRFHLRRRKS